MRSVCPFTQNRLWLILTVALILSLAANPSGQILTGPPVSSGGGGISPSPPKANPRPTPATPVDQLTAPLYVAVSGPASSYTVVITSPSGSIVATGTTNAQGLVQLTVPAVIGLELDVLDTTVVGLPVSGGQAISITIP